MQGVAPFRVELRITRNRGSATWDCVDSGSLCVGSHTGNRAKPFPFLFLLSPLFPDRSNERLVARITFFVETPLEQVLSGQPRAKPGLEGTILAAEKAVAVRVVSNQAASGDMNDGQHSATPGANR